MAKLRTLISVILAAQDRFVMLKNKERLIAA